MPAYDQMYQSAVASSGAAGRTAGDDYYRRLQAFDPMQYLQSANQAAVSGALEQYGYDDAGRRTSLAASGFRPSSAMGGAATVRDLNDRIARAMAGNALQAGEMQMRNTAQIGQYGANQQQSYYDLLAGGMDREQMQKNAKKSRWANLAGGLGALAGGAIGTFLLPGIGTELGASLGGGLGRGVGGMVG